MNHRCRQLATITSRDARDAEIVAAWHLGRMSLLWAIAFALGVIVGAPPAAPETSATQPEPPIADAGMTWGA